MRRAGLQMIEFELMSFESEGKEDIPRTSGDFDLEETVGTSGTTIAESREESSCAQDSMMTTISTKWPILRRYMAVLNTLTFFAHVRSSCSEGSQTSRGRTSCSFERSTRRYGGWDSVQDCMSQEGGFDGSIDID